MPSREYNFDGLVGPTHNYGGLSVGNVASVTNGGQVSNPREAALQGLEKMKFVAGLGVGQAVLPPQPRPNLRVLRRLGFRGTDEALLLQAAAQDEHLLRLVSSAAAMWTANAATHTPSEDATDGKAHLTSANLQQMFHRTIEADDTDSVLRAISKDTRYFEVHPPLPGGGQFADEGAANHTRLVTEGHRAVHLFAWGRSAFQKLPAPTVFPARQTLEASHALARLHSLPRDTCLFPQQSPEGIDAGAFHTDVLAVGNQGVLLLHEKAFLETASLLITLKEKLGPTFRSVLATEKELPARDAVQAYPFNSQLVTLPSGKMAIVAPRDAETNVPARTFLERVVAEDNPVEAVHYLDLRQSMNNGGGPACLRQRICLTDAERSAISARVFFDDALHAELAAWVRKFYRDRLVAKDLQDPELARTTLSALDALTKILSLGAVYDFQR